ncbi:hypothetical protein E4U52_003143 [Claviceps spartinae]|nr:hypothetical protein E4U52_003143 [Claviceps spartinae]
MTRQEMIRRFRGHMTIHEPAMPSKFRAGAFITADDANLAEGVTTFPGSKEDASSAADSVAKDTKRKSASLLSSVGRRTTGAECIWRELSVFGWLVRQAFVFQKAVLRN